MRQTVKQIKTSKAEKNNKPTSKQGAFTKYCVRSQSKLCATTQKENSSQSVEVKEV